jgi:hypothetical protein
MNWKVSSYHYALSEDSQTVDRYTLSEDSQMVDRYSLSEDSQMVHRSLSEDSQMVRQRYKGVGALKAISILNVNEAIAIICTCDR